MMMKEISKAIATDDMSAVAQYAKDYGIDMADIMELYDEYVEMMVLISEMDINEFFVEFGDDV